MTNEQKQVQEWMAAFGQDTPEKPCVPSLEVRKLRAKLILEEALETIEALGIYPKDLRPLSNADRRVFPDTPFSFEEYYPESLIDLSEIADGCEDLKVVTEGTLVACGLTNHVKYSTKPCGCGVDPLFDEIMRSNWSKMWTEDELDVYLSDDECKKHQAIKHGDKYIVKDFSGKIIKSPSYSPANLQPIIDELSHQIHADK